MLARFVLSPVDSFFDQLLLAMRAWRLASGQLAKNEVLMKLYSLLMATFALSVLAGNGRAAQITLSAQGSMTPPTTPPVQSLGVSSGLQVQIAERLFTSAVTEPNGFVAVCFATNLDTVARDLVAQIIDSRGVEVTQSSSCGARLASGVTCDSMAHFANNFPLRCVIGTGGKATTLRGGMTTSSGPFPFTSPANLTVPAQ